MRMKNKLKGRRLLRSAATMLCLAMMFFTMSGMAMATGEPDAADSAPEITGAVIGDAPEGAEESPVPEESEPPISEPVPEPAEPTPEDTPSETAETPEAEYEIEADIPTGWHNAPVTINVRIVDKNGTGWNKAEAALGENAQRTDLTEALDRDGTAAYTVPDNGTVYIFITDSSGSEHKKELTVSCMDFEAPRLRAGVSGTLLRVEASDALSGMAGIYVNDELYTTLQNGEFSVRIDKNTRDSHFYIMGMDNAGNRTSYVVIANPFYEEKEEAPSPTPDVGDSAHNAHCPADCDCREQSSTGSGNSSVSGSTGGGQTSGAATAKPAVSQTPASAQTSQTAKPQETAAASEPVTIENGTGFTENGSAVTRDLLYDKHTNKQFITVETRNGHTLYLVIDYDKPLDEDGDQYETYFLNLVDESDLLALIDEDSAPVCSCTNKCEAGQINTACAVCKNNMTECAGKISEPVKEPEVTPEPEPEPAQKSSGSGLIVLVLMLLMAGGGALYWFKLRKKKPDTKGPVDLDDYDYGDEDEEYENEDDEEEPEETEDADA